MKTVKAFPASGGRNALTPSRRGASVTVLSPRHLIAFSFLPNDMMHQESHRLRALVHSFTGRKIVVVGDLMLDRYLWGQVNRISPEAPVPVVDVVTESSRPGGAANVAANLAALGARPLLFGAVGSDAAARELCAHMAEQGIDPGGLEAAPGRPTTVKTRIMAHGTQVARVDREEKGPLPPEVAKKLRERIGEALDDADAVVVSDYGKGVVSSRLVRFLVERTRGGPWVGVDPKDPTLLTYRGVSVVTPNLAEAGTAFGRPLTSEALLMEAGRALRERLGVKALLITRGDQGLSLFEEGGTFTHFPTVALEVYDVTGAGDTVTATLMLAVAAGASLPEAAAVANHAAGVAVREVGTAAVTADELLASLED